MKRVLLLMIVMIGIYNTCFSQSSENFDGVVLSGGYSFGSSPRVINGWTFRLLTSTGIDAPGPTDPYTPSSIDVTNNDFLGGGSDLADGNSDKAIFFYGYFGVAKTAVIKNTSGTEFKLISFYIDNIVYDLDDKDLIVRGYKDNSEVVTQNIVANGAAPTLITLVGAGWNSIDEFRIEKQSGESDISFYIDDINLPPPLSATQSQTNVACFGGTTGSATVVASGGTGPYTYSWAPSGGSGATALNLTAGTYTVTITDANSSSITKNFTITQPGAPLGGTTSGTDVSCFGGSNGTAKVTPTGGTAPYTYSWAPTGGTAATASGLPAGTYTVTVTDNNNCTATFNYTVNQPASALSTSMPVSTTDVSCNGGNNGTATVTPTGGTAPYFYSWAPTGGSGATATGLPAGTYTVTITDSKGCFITRSGTVNQPALALGGTATKTDVSCNGGNNGTATVAATGGTAPYTYSWAPSGGTAATSTGLVAGTYTVTVTDFNGCQITRTTTVNQPALALDGTATKTDVSCNGGANGTATVAVTGGTTPYSYSWAPSGGTNATATGLTTGTYTVTVTDFNGCQITRTATVNQPALALDGTISKTDVSCHGGSNGTVAVSASGGTPAYTYQWSNGATTAMVSGLATGTYSVTVTDANACQITRSVTVDEPATSITVVPVAQTNIACNGGATGSATVSVTGGTGAYTYSWAPSGGTAATATGLTAGTYTVTVTDANGCTDTQSFTITQPPALVASVGAQSNVSCNGGANGTATVSVTGGTPGYTYSWAPSGGTSATAMGLSAGTYTVTVTDANGCTTTQSFTITEPAALVASAGSQTNVSCNGGSNGTATVAVTGGTGAYTYSWAPSGGTGATASGLAAGTYTVTVTDANTCQTTQSFTITEPSLLVASVGSQTDVSCHGGANGTATVSVTGGTPGYTYSWAPSGGTAATASGLIAGTYTVTVTDANNCQTTQSFTITEPPVLNATAVAQTNIACNGGATGSATVSVTGGTGAYTYSWAPSGGTAATATGLTAGTYTVTVTDANGCTDTQSFTITQPPALVASVGAQSNVSCNGGANGTATVSVTGGTPGYTYSWAPSGGTGATASALAAGTYTVTVTDANGCTTTQSFTITEPAALVASAGSQTNVSCNGGSNGTATVAVTGGTGAYTYSWAPSGGTGATASGLAAGTYTVTVMDANTCQTTQSFTITEPSLLVASVGSQTDVSCHGGANGTATVSVTGGTGSYTYSWAPSGGTAATASGLIAGTYTVTVTDANNCQTTQSFTITEPPVLNATAVAQTNIACNGGATGSATVSVTGGTGAYTYSWAPSGGTAATATGLTAGTYTVTVTDANGCTDTQSFTITQPPALVASVGAQSNVSCNGGANGTATVSVTGGTPGYTYSWAPSGGTSATAMGLSAGTYTVTVTDANGCTTTQSFTITEPAALVASAGSQTNVSCNGGSNGTATVAVTGGTGAYTYSWAPSGGTGATASGLAAGTYTVTVMDANTCQTTQSFTITEPSLLVASVGSQTDVSCHGGANGTATVSVSGGTPGYTYSWAPSGGTAAIASGLIAGTYTVTVTDANSCTTTQSFTITEPPVLNATAVAQTNIACNGGATGSATVSVTGGTGAYTYSWAPSGGTAATATGLTAGTYTVTVTDANGCTDTQSFTITQPPALVASVGAQSNVSCNGGANGTATVSVTGGTPGYTYSWAPSGGTGATASALAAGTYTVTVTDANGCTTTQSFTITEPAALVASAGSQTNVSCNGGSNGTATVAVTGGTGAYTYSWAPSGGTGATASGLAAGTYTVTVTDANACTTTQSFTITEPSVLVATALAQTNIGCNGAATGSATVGVTGGTGSYTYSWAPSGGTAATATGLTAGTYTVTVTDANGCTATQSFTLTQPTVLVASAGAQTNVSCNGGANGSATVNVTGGTPGYTYSWAPSGGTAATATGLAAGTYTVTVTDANLCSTTQSFTITEPTLLTATVSQVNVSTAGGNNGSATVNVTGGTGAYSYSWTPSGGTAATATGLTAGTYVCTVTDANGCIHTETFKIIEPATLSGFVALIKNYGDADFTLNAPTSNSTGAFSYTSSDASVASVTGNMVTIHKPGVVTITVSQAADANHLVASATASLTVNRKDITVSLNATPVVTKQYDGNVQASLASANYQLNGIVGADDVTVTGTAQYDNRNAGTGKIITVNGFVLSGLQNAYYTLTTTSATTIGEITAKPIIATAGATSKVYDGTDAATVNFNSFTAANGLVGADDVQVQYTSATYNTKDVGVAKPVTINGLTLSGADQSNYSLNAFTTTGDIVAKAITVTATAGQTKVYGSTDPVLAYTISAGGPLAAGDAFAGALVRTTGENVGTTYVINQGSLTAGANYAITYVGDNFAITPKQLTITADNKEMFEGDAVPALTVTYNGFANGDDNNSLTTQPVVSTTATSASLTGNYPITASGAASANYTITYVSGTMNVKAAAPTDITLASTTLYENMPAGSTAGSLSSTSGNPAATYTYSLVPGTGDNDNASFVISGNAINAVGSFDFEQKSTFNIRVRSTTQSNIWLEKTFTITIKDVNEKPTIDPLSDKELCHTAIEEQIGVTGISAGPELVQTYALTIQSDRNIFNKLEIVKGNNGKATIRYILAQNAVGDAVIKVTVKDNGGVANGGVDLAEQSFKLTVNALPVFTVNSSVPSLKISKGDIVELSAVGNATAYEWANVDGIIGSKNDPKVQVRPMQTTTYKVRGLNAKGCFVDQSVTIEVIEDFKLNATNVITPNGDGYNDKWLVRNIESYPNNVVKVFDKAGRIIYTKSGYLNEWDGTMNGEPLHEDTYYYIIDLGNGSKLYKGYITIVRD